MKNKMTAFDLMSGSVEQVYIEDTIETVARLFVSRGIGAAPVIGKSGLPVGVITKTDLSRYDAVRLRLMPTGEGRDSEKMLTEGKSTKRAGFYGDPEAETIEEWFTPRIYSVPPEAPLASVIRTILGRRVHHVFVKEKRSFKIIGVITSFDLVRLLKKSSSNKKANKPFDRRRP